LLFRYRARNWPETLTPEERERWEMFRVQRLTRATPLTTLTLPDYFAKLNLLRNDPLSRDKSALLDQLQAWGEQLATEAGVVFA
jgi:exodeoxyribonuclease-1